MLNTNKTSENGNQILDAKEVKQAKSWGFSLFNLKENVTFKEFEVAYQSYVDEHDDLTELNNQEYKIHVKNLQLKYGTDLEPNEGEDIKDFEARLEKEFGSKNELKKPVLGDLKKLEKHKKHKFYGEMMKVDTRIADIKKIENGEMTVSEFSKKYGIKIDEKIKPEE